MSHHHPLTTVAIDLFIVVVPIRRGCSSHPCLSPSRHASQMRPMLLAPNPSLALLLCRPPSRSKLQVVSKTLPSVGESLRGVIDTCRRTHDFCLLDSRLFRIPTWRSRLISEWVARPRRGIHDLCCRLSSFHSMFKWVARPRRGIHDLCCRLSSFHCSCRPTYSGSCLPRNVGDVLRGAATGSLSLGCRLRSAATRNLGQPDDLSSLALGVGHLSRNVGSIIQH